MNNGDQVSGDITSMSGKSVIVETKYAGEIELQWVDIANLTTDSDITVLMADKSRVSGKVTRAENGQIVLDGATPSTLNFSDIAKFNPVPMGTYVGAGQFHFGGFRAQGNTEKFAIHTDLEYVLRNEVNRFTLGGIYNLGGDNGKESENNLRLYGKYDRFFDDHWYGYF